MGIKECFTDQNGIKPLKQNRNAMPKKRRLSGSAEAAAERPATAFKKSNTEDWVGLNRQWLKNAGDCTWRQVQHQQMIGEQIGQLWCHVFVRYIFAF